MVIAISQYNIHWINCVGQFSKRCFEYVLRTSFGELCSVNIFEYDRIL